MSRDLDRSIKMANRALNAEVLKSPPVKWDEKRGPAHKAAIPDLMTAQSMLLKHLTAWDTLRKQWPGRVLETEKTVWVDLTKFDKPWKLQCRIDTIVEEDGKKGILDYKSAGKAWTEEKLQEHKPQAYLYMGAEWYRTKIAPDWFEFWVFIKGTDKIISHRFPFDAATINLYLTQVVRPTILSIEAGAYIPNTDFWGCDIKYCEYFSRCEVGQMAHPEQAQQLKEMTQ
jgi:PD-(D/E)XK nuclease superfamily